MASRAGKSSLDFGSQHIPAPRKSFQDMVRAFTKGPSEIADALGQAVICHNDARPESVEQLLPLVEPSRMLKQVAEEKIGFGPKGHIGSVWPL